MLRPLFSSEYGLILHSLSPLQSANSLTLEAFAGCTLFNCADRAHFSLGSDEKRSFCRLIGEGKGYCFLVGFGISGWVA